MMSKKCSLCDDKIAACMRLAEEMFGVALLSIIETLVGDQVPAKLQDKHLVCPRCATNLWQCYDLRTRCLKVFSKPSAVKRSRPSQAATPIKRRRDTIAAPTAAMLSSSQVDQAASNVNSNLTSAGKMNGHQQDTPPVVAESSEKRLEASQASSSSKPHAVYCDTEESDLEEGKLAVTDVSASNVAQSKSKMSNSTFVRVVDKLKQTGRTSTPTSSKKPTIDFACSHCTYVTGVAAAFKRHTVQFHNTPPLEAFKCQICDKSYAHGTRYKTHMLGHMEKEAEGQESNAQSTNGTAEKTAEQPTNTANVSESEAIKINAEVQCEETRSQGQQIKADDTKAVANGTTEKKVEQLEQSKELDDCINSSVQQLVVAKPKRKPQQTLPDAEQSAPAASPRKAKTATVANSDGQPEQQTEVDEPQAVNNIKTATQVVKVERSEDMLDDVNSMLQPPVVSKKKRKHHEIRSDCELPASPRKIAAVAAECNDGTGTITAKVEPDETDTAISSDSQRTACSVCGKKVKIGKLAKHLAHAHEQKAKQVVEEVVEKQPEIEPCSFCTKAFKNAETLNKHIRRKHPDIVC